MKKRAFHHMLLILLVTCLLTTGCSQPSGDAPLSGTGSSPSAFGFTILLSTSTSRIQYGEDLEVTIGFKISSFLLNIDTGAPIIGKIEMIAQKANNSFDPIPGKSMLVKEYDNLSENLYQEYYFNDILYSAIIEKIYIPADWFSETTGIINFWVEMEIYTLGKSVGGKIGLYYAKDLFYFPNKSDFIQLFRSYYDFNNRNKPWRWFEWKNTEDESLPIY